MFLESWNTSKFERNLINHKHYHYLHNILQSLKTRFTESTVFLKAHFLLQHHLSKGQKKALKNFSPKFQRLFPPSNFNNRLVIARQIVLKKLTWPNDWIQRGKLAVKERWRWSKKWTTFKSFSQLLNDQILNFWNSIKKLRNIVYSFKFKEFDWFHWVCTNLVWE